MIVVVFRLPYLFTICSPHNRIDLLCTSGWSTSHRRCAIDAFNFDRLSSSCLCSMKAANRGSGVVACSHRHVCATELFPLLDSSESITNCLSMKVSVVT